jgi:GAF domain-containing protein/ANTAR domain-containing protein
MVERQPAKDHAAVGDTLTRICRASRDGLRMTGSAVTLMSETGHEAVAGSSSSRFRKVAAMEFDLGEGPSRAAFAQGSPVLVGDLTDGVAARWPGFSSAAGEKGIRAAFAFPMQVATSRLGALSMYADEPRTLREHEISRASAFADLATEALIQSSPDSRDGGLSAEVTSILDLRTEVFQAQGMVMAALDVDLPEAIARMRAHAFASGRDLDDVALDIIERRLDPEGELT